MRRTLFLICVVVSLRVAAGGQATTGATAPVVTRPLKTIHLRDMGVLPSPNVSDAELAGWIAQGGQNQLFGFDGNMHIADVTGDVFILYREERKGMQTWLQVYRVDLQAGKSIGVSLPFQILMEDIGTVQNNVSLERMADGKLLARVNQHLAIIDEGDLRIENRYGLDEVGNALLEVMVMPSGKEIAAHWRSGDKETYVWYSLPSFAEVGRQSIKYDPERIMTAAGTSLILRLEDEGIRAYPESSVPFLACAGQICKSEMVYLGGDRFLLHGEYGAALLDSGTSPAKTHLDILHAGESDSAFAKISKDGTIAAVIASGRFRRNGVTYPTGRYQMRVFDLTSRRLQWQVDFKPRPGAFDFFLADDHRSVWMWQDDATLWLYKEPSSK